MSALLLFSPSADLLKGYIKAHTRVLKNGRTIEIAAHYDKRTKKGAEHAPGHGHDTGHLSESDRDRFDRMHAEQHLLHHYRGHALRQRIAEHEATIADLHAQAKAHSDAGRHKEAAKLANRALKHNARRLRHQRELEKIDAAVAGIGRMKEALAQGRARSSQARTPRTRTILRSWDSTSTPRWTPMNDSRPDPARLSRNARSGATPSKPLPGACEPSPAQDGFYLWNGRVLPNYRYQVPAEEFSWDDQPSSPIGSTKDWPSTDTSSLSGRP
ncbi:MAG: hypothetical protein MZV65_32010 [Chromatiales bacterium]|nr:hypothetical protein [Chromatiales bacterium]